MRPDVSILVVSWNTRAETLACLDSIPVGIDDGTTYEVIVVDNASKDGSPDALRTRDDIHFIGNEDNLGFAIGVNQAYEASSGEYILLLNSDVAFRPGALSELVRFLRTNEDAVGVGPLYLNPDGSVQQHHFRFPTFANLVANVSRSLGRLPSLERREHSYRMIGEDFSKARPVEQPSASCLLMRRTDLPGEKLMDERYPIYFNDVALARSLSATGRSLWMTPDSVVEHEHGASTRLLGGALRRQYIGALVLYMKATDTFLHLAFLRALVFAQGLASLVLRRPGALPLRDLVAALRGDPGPLPQAPSRLVAS